MRTEIMFDYMSLTFQQKSQILKSFFSMILGKHRQLRKLSQRKKPDKLKDWSFHFLRSHFQKQPSKMHLWLFNELDAAIEKQPKQWNLLAPRGSAKSTIGTLAYPLRESLEGREPYIWIVSNTKSQAHAHLENIKYELTENNRLAQSYPQSSGKGNVWKTGSIILKNGVMIEAFGMGQRIRGRRYKSHRPSLIICDDIQNDNHIFSSLARDNSRAWFHGTLMKAGNPETKILNLATALHQEAIAVELLNSPGWTSKRFQAIEKWPNNIGLWEQWEQLYTETDRSNASENARQFYLEHKEKMTEGSEVLWPEHEPLELLMRMRMESGRSTFEREKQNSPINPEFCEWSESYFDETIWFEKYPATIQCRVLSLDPSKGTESGRGDYSAFVLLTLTENGTLYVEADLARRAVPEIVSQGVELYKTFKPDVFVIESNQFQDLLHSDFSAEFAAQNMSHVRPFPLENRVNKIVRIRRLGPLLSMKKLKFRQNSVSTKLLVDQLKMFPVGDHDDGPDALEMAVRVLNKYAGSP